MTRSRMCIALAASPRWRRCFSARGVPAAKPRGGDLAVAERRRRAGRARSRRCRRAGRSPGWTRRARPRHRKRPLSVKIENSPAARPQTGLNSADVVYETVTEGGITRFNAHLPEQGAQDRRAGAQRPALRPLDRAAVPRALLLLGSERQRQLRGEAGQAPEPVAGRRRLVPVLAVERSRVAPHNLYLDTKKAYAEAKKRGITITADVPPLQFGPASAVTSATAVKSVYIPFSSFNNVTWTWSKKQRAFLRENNGKVHRDAATGKQVAAKNVVVMWAKYTRGEPRQGRLDHLLTSSSAARAASRSSATASATTARGSRPATQPPRFVDKKGRPIKLAPGNTWFQVVPLDVNITMK